MTAKGIRLAILAGLAAVVTVAAVHAQQQRVRPLSPEDYIEIQQLVARYPYALDGGLEGGRAWADLFTDDAVFEHVGRHRFAGRQELLPVANKPNATTNNVSHFTMNHMIQPTADGATGKAYLILISPFGEMKDGRTASSVQTYHYEDVYVKTTNGWRFKSRTVLNDPNNPNNREQARPATRR